MVYAREPLHRIRSSIDPPEQLNGIAFLRICLADQNATFSSVRMNKRLTQSFLEMCFEAVLEQKRGDANGPQLAYIYFEDARVAISD
jgi:hypothetical protein